ncbi:MAG TPA: hypothetical protein VFN56_03060 [Candidatus Saccharimonadales bacterium]|nr:hypothetical protein [Candidatus Saccharimonadales bacterium]
MSDLQTAYYIIAIVFMGVMFLLLIGLLAAVLVIRSKVNAIHDRIEEKIAQISGVAEKGAAVLGTLKKVTGKVSR